LRLFRAFARGRQREEREAVLYRRTAGPVEVELSSPARLLADGDLPVETARFRVATLPGRLRFIVPRGGPHLALCDAPVTTWRAWRDVLQWRT
jgi:diacylglycerol kinase family enzyme